jgi:hypothetical protein
MASPTVTVRIFGSLRPFADELGLPYELESEVPDVGLSGRELADRIGLPVDKIEGFFVNHVVRPLDVRVMPGDQTAFVPADTPGPHRFFLGLWAAGKGMDAGENH